MFSPPRLQFAARGLRVSYRASSEAQRLDVRLVMGRAMPSSPVPLWMRSFVDGVHAGLAGGDAFAPELGRAKVVRGSLAASPRVRGPEFHWALDVRAVCPESLRVMVESLSLGHGEHVDDPHARALSIEGSLPPGRDAASVTTPQMRRWLADATAFPRAWSRPPFEIVTKRPGRTPKVEVLFAAAPVPETLTTLEARLVDAVGLAGLGWNRAHDGPARIGFPTTTSNVRRVVVGWDRIDADAPVAAAALTNALCRLHVNVAPIARATIAV